MSVEFKSVVLGRGGEYNGQGELNGRVRQMSVEFQSPLYWGLGEYNGQGELNGRVRQVSVESAGMGFGIA